MDFRMIEYQGLLILCHDQGKRRIFWGGAYGNIHYKAWLICIVSSKNENLLILSRCLFGEYMRLFLWFVSICLAKIVCSSHWIFCILHQYWLPGDLELQNQRMKKFYLFVLQIGQCLFQWWYKVAFLSWFDVFFSYLIFI